MTLTRLASQVVRLGYYMGYAPPGTSPLELIALAQEAERLGYDSAWAAEAWGTDAVTRALVARRDDDEAQGRQRDHADPGPHAREHGDDGGDARSALRRPVPARARDVGAAGRRGLARRAVGEAAREDARVRRDRAFGAASRDGRASRLAVRDPVPRRRRDGAREAAEADAAPAARGDPDLPRRDLAEGGRARVRDRRRLDPDLLLAGSRARGVRAERPCARRLRHRRVRARGRDRRPAGRRATR